MLEGFKSYGQRTVIDGFDREFNAITGLNGTGKSNILDSICFVLGITQLTNVRVNALQDLVYKSGQSGITKATVSITFDNSDKANSPMGFEKYSEITVTRQVVIGGKNKYIINGVNVQNKKVQDLFCTVHLNVNNPHFLIMQGRITKVLNMKPPEILSMIEEAAGTKMYESKKQIAEKNIDKKDAKLKEINDLAEDEVIPKLNKLREERKMYQEFQRVERELENFSAMFTAFQFIQAKRIMHDSLEALEHKTAEVQKIEAKIAVNKERANEIDAEVTEYQQKNSKNDEVLANIETNLSQREKILAKCNATEKATKNAITVEEKRKQQLIGSVKDDETALKSKENEMSGANEMFQKLKDSETVDKTAFIKAQNKFEAINAGMEIGDDGEASTLQEQLIKAKQDSTEAATAAKQALMQLQHCESQLKQKQKDMGATASDYKHDKTTVENLEKDLKNLTKQLEKLNYDETKIHSLQEQKRKLVYECRSIREKIERFEAQHPRINFQYTDPEPHFNRRSVKGMVCSLINLKDKSAAMALETAAGNRIYNVITDTEITSKKLLQKGQLQQRTTIIPLNKIKGSAIPNDVVNYAQQLVGKENVRPALSLIQFGHELQPAMEFIFGGAFICRDMNIAKEITYNDRILRKCVTLDGDVVDPSGTLSGGALRQGGSFLLQLEEYKQYQAELSAKEQELAKLEVEIQNMSRVAEKYAELKQKFDITSYEFNVVRSRLQQTSHYQQQEEIDNLKRTISEMQTSVKDNKDKENVFLAKAKQLENDIKNSKNNKEQKIKAAENEMNRLKTQAENSKKLWKENEQYYETLKLEITELEKAILNGHEQIKACDTNDEKLQTELIEALENVHQSKAIVTEIQTKLKEEKQRLNAKNKDIRKKLKEKTEILAQVSEMELEIKKESHDIKELEKKCRDFKTHEAELKSKIRKGDTRLKDAEAMTDREGSELGSRIAKAQEQRNKLSRTVNVKAQRMFDQEEKQYTALIKKKLIVENDKRKLLNIIADLDKEKIKFLKTASEQISKDFGSIFGTLLPGTDAKLKPSEGKSLLDGLEIKIAIGGIWKDNLSELSGGQKSLVALSLILAMLLFKPAPIYILDEVDAALDLSHTQNIGKMLKKHFKQSQFIIVSLKDGMFNNANVLFRTKFVEGVSAVTRTVSLNSR